MNNSPVHAFLCPYLGNFGLCHSTHVAVAVLAQALPRLQWCMLMKGHQVTYFPQGRSRQLLKGNCRYEDSKDMLIVLLSGVLDLVKTFLGHCKSSLERSGIPVSSQSC